VASLKNEPQKFYSMKRTMHLVAALTVLAFTFIASVASAQRGNPLMNIPVTVPGMQNASICITDFKVSSDQIKVTSTLTCYTPDGHPVVMPAQEVPVLLTSVSCDNLLMSIGGPVVINNKEFIIGFVSVNISSKMQKNDNSLTNALCSIAKLYQNNASPHTLIAKLQQLVRAFS
jgi:hypothetical protein